MSDIKVKLNNNSLIKARVGTENTIKAIPTVSSTAASSLNALNDVDISNLGDGYVLVYDGTTQKWTATNTLTPGEDQDLIINGGNF